MNQGDINALKPEMHLNNILSSVPVSQKIRCLPITKTSWLKLHKEILAQMQCETQMKHINTLCRYGIFFNIKASVVVTTVF
jgi:hypothetical protein